MNKIIIAFIMTATLSGCASLLAENVESCSNAANKSFNGQNEIEMYNTTAVKNFYTLIQNKPYKENQFLNLPNLTKNTIKPNGAIDVYALLYNIQYYESLQTGQTESRAKKSANLTVQGFTSGLVIHHKSICTYQEQLRKPQ